MSSYATLLSRANVSNGSNKRATQASSLARRFAGLLSNIGRVFISHNNNTVRFSVFRISQESIISGAPAKEFRVNQREIYVLVPYVSRKKGVAKRDTVVHLDCHTFSQVCWISKHEDGWNVKGKEKPCEPVGKCKLPYSEAERHSGPP